MASITTNSPHRPVPLTTLPAQAAKERAHAQRVARIDHYNKAGAFPQTPRRPLAGLRATPIR